MVFKKRKRLFSLFAAVLLIAGSLLNPATVFAEEDGGNSGERDYRAEAEARKGEPVQSNEIDNWPRGPQVGAEGAIVMEVNTGAILYAKNIDEHLYPASTTKVLTTLVAMEHTQDLNEMVKFSTEAVFGIERGSSNMGMDVGQSITMEQCLYGILVYSANEVCNAVAEHIAGSIDGFVEMMNQKAAELGCTNSHFVTTNGLHDENHYTSPRDLATIACEFFKDETLSKIAGTRHYYIGPTDTQPDDIDLYTHNKLTAGTYPYEGYIGGKTGYTTVARQTLVSCAERNGIRLVCVIMKEESPNQFLDTIELFDYAFDNFERLNVAENETDFTMENNEIFETDSDIFFSGAPITEIDKNGYVVIPKTATFADLEKKLSYVGEGEAVVEGDYDRLARIDYTYQGQNVGSAYVMLTEEKENEVDDITILTDTEGEGETGSRVVFINVLKVVGIVAAVFAVVLVIILIITIAKSYSFGDRRSNRRRRKRWKTRDPFDRL